MILGLGTGSTTGHFIDILGERLREGELESIVGVPTSQGTAARARRWGIPLTTLKDHPRLDLTVDGADEVDSQLNLIKGLGRALLREKIVEIHTEQFVVIVDESKVSSRLGTHSPLPIEIAPFAAEIHVRWLNTVSSRSELWLEEDGKPVVTDNGHYMARCWFDEGIAAPYALSQTLITRPGVLEHGLFLDMADIVIVAGPQGNRLLERS
jgi:ribose 5-phosphate isomerase A